MRALVLGASGFLGRWIARRLARDGAALFATARDPSALEEVQREYGFGGEAFRLDVLDARALAELLEEVGPDAVFNAVGYGVDRSERDEARMRRINAELPEAIARLLAPSQILIHAGSALEYGPIGGDLHESSTPNPTTLYGRTKLEGTERLRAYALQAGLRSCVARLFTLYGPGEHEGRLLPTLFAARRSAEPLDFTEGTQRRDFTYVEDAADSLVALAKCGVSSAEIVNVATGRSTSVRDFIETAIRVLGIPRERVRFGALPARKNEEMCHDDVAIAHLRSLIGHAPAIDIEEGIARAMWFGHTREGARTD